MTTQRYEVIIVDRSNSSSGKTGNFHTRHFEKPYGFIAVSLIHFAHG